MVSRILCSIIMRCTMQIQEEDNGYTMRIRWALDMRRRSEEQDGGMNHANTIDHEWLRRLIATDYERLQPTTTSGRCPQQQPPMLQRWPPHFSPPQPSTLLA